jgi:hypothetical protein
MCEYVCACVRVRICRQTLYACVPICACVCVFTFFVYAYICVCVCARERERERESELLSMFGILLVKYIYQLYVSYVQDLTFWIAIFC